VLGRAIRAGHFMSRDDTDALLNTEDTCLALPSSPTTEIRLCCYYGKLPDLVTRCSLSGAALSAIRF
jgi:hypothetical protein